MSTLPPFIAPMRFTDPHGALAQVTLIYETGIQHLRQSMQRFVASEDDGTRMRAFYPMVRIHTDTVLRSGLPDTARLSYGFVAGPGRFETTLTRPDLFQQYYLEQFRLLLLNHDVELEVCTSALPIPVHFSFAEHDHVEGTMDAQRRMLMRDRFDLPDLAAMDDGIANGTYSPQPGDALPLSLFNAPRVDYSLHRLRHYTGTGPEHFQNFVLFTNYQFYIDEFIALGHAAMAEPNSEYIAFVEPGNVIRRRVGLEPEASDALGTRKAAAKISSKAPRSGVAPPATNAGLPLDARGPHRHYHGQYWRGPGQCQKHYRPHCGAATPRLDHVRALRRTAQHAAARRLRTSTWIRARRSCAGRRVAAVGTDTCAGRNSASAGASRG